MRNSVLTEEVNKILLSANNDKRIQSINSIKVYRINKNLVCKREDIKCKNIKQYKMFNYNDVTKENINEHNPIWSQIPDLSYRIIIFGGSRLGKTNA